MALALKKVFMISKAGSGEFDGVGDYASRLAEELSGARQTFLLTLNKKKCAEGIYLQSWQDLWRSRKSLPLTGPDIFLIHYIPQHLMGITGIYFYLLLFWIWIFRKGPLVIYVHEMDIAFKWTWRRLGAKILLYLSVLSLSIIAARLVFSHSHSLDNIKVRFPWTAGRVHLIPIGSAIRNQQAAGKEPEFPQLIFFGQPSNWEDSIMTRLMVWHHKRAGEIGITWVSRSKAEMEDAVRSWSRSTPVPPIDLREQLEPRELSLLLANASLFLAPYADGVSGRRSTLAAALQHQMPVIGTDGPCTDPHYRSSRAFLLSSLHDPEQFIRNLEQVLSDPAQRSRMRHEADLFYRSHVSWEVIRQSFLSLFSELDRI